MSLSILNVAYPFAPVGPDTTGGAEQILSTLDHALVNAGHHSIVIAEEGSNVTGTLIASHHTHLQIDESLRRQTYQNYSCLIREALARFDIDLIHFHGIDFHRYLPDGDIPALATLHLPLEWYPKEIFQCARSNFYLNCVSTSQQKTCSSSTVPIHCIPNGIPVDSFHISSETGDYALALGRICGEKGFHFALDAARQANVPMVLAGEVFPYEEHQRYFDAEIRPRLDSQRQFIGPVDFERKVDLLARAKCLLIPSTVAETSSLVAMEALASGTPVIAFRSGALPEIIEHGQTGYLVSDAAEMAEGIANVHKVDRENCRRTACQRFSATEMIRGYFSLYQQILQHE